MRWLNIRQILRARDKERAAPPPDAFWTDFRARARMTSQQAPETGRRSPLGFGFPEWTIAAVCVLLVVVAGWFMAAGGPGEDVPPNKIHSLRISVPYTAVLMMYDPLSKATILWVDGLALGDGENGV